MADAVLRCIRHDVPEILVGNGPLRLAGAFAELLPRSVDAFMGSSSVKGHFEEQAEEAERR